MYNGFYCFETMTQRSMDDVICGICGTIGQLYLGDGNQKNCCSLKGVSRFFIQFSISSFAGFTGCYIFINYQVKQEKVGALNQQHPMKLEEFLLTLKRDWVERTTFSNELVGNTYSLHAATIPPIIAPALRCREVLNTEMEKKSIYLSQKNIATSM